MQPFTVKSVPPHLPSFLKAERGIEPAAAGLKTPYILGLKPSAAEMGGGG
jgi:hypothetical protein